jgi:putative ATPase
MEFDLFHQKPTPPLAELLRPQTLEEVVGQEHLLGEGKPLRIAFKSKKLHSMILWGPPGVGKTTLARLTASAFDCDFISLSAVFAGVKDIRTAMEMAQQNLNNGKKSILFVDEIHRFNKAQQDALLPFVESGLVFFIGATTENPSFEVNSALLSRAQVYVLQSFERKDFEKLFIRVQNHFKQSLSFEEEAKSSLIDLSDGDARRFLGLMDQIYSAAKEMQTSVVTLSLIQNVLSVNAKRFDKNGDHFYDQISALHKSVRGSDPDAALYWLCRMLDGGADGKYLARRIIRMSWEDIGLADPRGIQIAQDAANTFERLGSPEGELALAQAVIYLALAPKSNAGYKAYNEAKAFIKNDGSRPVPNHLRNAPTKMMKEMGMGKEYRYAHDEPNGYVAGENYFPENMPKPSWYRPVNRGLEIQIGQKLKELRDLDSHKS